jgi:putative spermidine/putrescine transport system ATP-binding protein
MIDLNNLTKKFNNFTAVNNVDLTVNKGEFITILGPSGSGKTTLLTLIAGFEDPTSGNILIDGRDVIGLPAEKRNIGLVFQSYALFPHMSVFDNLAFPLKVRKVPSEKITKEVRKALELVRLEQFENRKIHEISGGQQQRVALARAFIFEPSILLLDEPMAALDRKLRQELQFEMRELQRSLGITTISVTHDQEEALTMSDKILILNQGRIEQLGTPTDLYSRPVNRFVANFLGSGNFFNGSMSVENGDNEVFICDNGVNIKCNQSGLENGERACLMIRPEQIKIESNINVGEGIRGYVKNSIYLGSSTRYQIEVQNEEIITVNDSINDYRFKEGENVKLSWNPEKNWFLPVSSEETLESKFEYV